MMVKMVPTKKGWYNDDFLIICLYHDLDDIEQCQLSKVIANEKVKWVVRASSEVFLFRDFCLITKPCGAYDLNAVLTHAYDGLINSLTNARDKEWISLIKSAIDNIVSLRYVAAHRKDDENIWSDFPVKFVADNYKLIECEKVKTGEILYNVSPLKYGSSAEMASLMKKYFIGSTDYMIEQVCYKVLYDMADAKVKRTLKVPIINGDGYRNVEVLVNRTEDGIQLAIKTNCEILLCIDEFEEALGISISLVNEVVHTDETVYEMDIIRELIKSGLHNEAVNTVKS